MENKGIVKENLSVKSEGTHLYLEGYAAVYGNVDSYKDIIQVGAFDAFLATEDVKRVKFCLNHNLNDVIGVVEELKSDERGLYFRAKLSNTTLGKDVAELIQDGALSEFSIGYKTEDSIYKDDGVRVLTKLYLYEFSVVSRAANPKAVLTDTERKDEEVKTDLTTMDYAQLESKLEELEAQKAEILAEMDARVIMAIKLN
jgi:HK97 family phage prohead protease